MTILVCILSGCDSYDTNHVNSNVDIEEYDNIINVKNALYLDVGFGWSYGWYRDNRSHITDLDTYIHPFISNWLVFRK